MAQRTRAVRVDDASRRSKVSAARRLIYEKNMQINCGAVENILRDMSLVPTSVSEQDICLIFIPLIPFFRMPFPIG